MRRFGFMSLCSALALGLGPYAAVAAPVVNPPTYVLFGTVAPATGGSSNNLFCTVPNQFLPYFASSSTFRRDGTGKATAFISFAQPVDFYVKPEDINFSGIAQLQFASATSGKVALDISAEQQNISTTTGKIEPVDLALTFTDYAQSYSAGVLKVSFKLTADKCTLPITAIYRDLGQ